MCRLQLKGQGGQQEKNNPKPKTTANKWAQGLLPFGSPALAQSGPRPAGEGEGLESSLCLVLVVTRHRGASLAPC